MKLRRARVSRRGRIEIIPMIDVMFFLLATFMLASLAMQRLDAVQINLPQGQARPVGMDQPLTMTITRANAILINRQPVQTDQIAAVILPLLRADHSIVIAADDGALHGVVVNAMLQARKAGIEHFLIGIDHAP